MNIYYSADMDIGLLKEKKILFIGYGSQGRAHALNLHDSGIKQISVFLPEHSSSKDKVLSDGFSLINSSRRVRDADIIVMAAPDEKHEEIYQNVLHDALKPKSLLLFMHGFSVHFGFISPKDNIDVAMISPKGPGPKLRSEYQAGRGLVSFLAIAQDVSGKAKDYALAYGGAIGSNRTAIFETTFREECECDLFGEQAVLCGGLAELIRSGYKTLVEAGYKPEIAYFECVHEIKLIADLLYQHGIAGMNRLISNTAEWGEYVSGHRIIAKESETAMKNCLHNIQTGAFAQEWMAQYRAGLPKFLAERKLRQEEEREKIGQKIRSFMPWIAE